MSASPCPARLIVRSDYAKENPDKVAAYLAVYLRSIAWQKANRAETIQLMKKFYEQGGVTLPEKYLATEIDTRPTFTLDEQIKLLDRSGGIVARPTSGTTSSASI